VGIPTILILLKNMNLSQIFYLMKKIFTREVFPEHKQDWYAGHSGNQHRFLSFK